MPGITQPVGRRERNKQRVKDRLYASALDLFTEQGYDHTSIDEIAERADVARGTFFNYFQRKDDLISAWGEQRRLKLLATLEKEGPAHGADAASRLYECMAVLGRINEEERDLTAAMLSAWVKAGRPLTEEPYIGRIFAEVVEAGRSKGELTADLTPEHVGNVLHDVYFGILYRWSQSTTAEQGALERELRAAVKLLLAGIAVQG
ncbi:TetR/AcrR family transcriptional regulator [Streptomyces sasae]|uniref:TetR/AcrR family transcriptional regulator n=1 Tax=Streptomyces sasae TaxID=1266772 RepID=UPI002930C24B|nr:TetR/AcrR family transcriptional regulator [Streptomyces sasae]